MKTVGSFDLNDLNNEREIYDDKENNSNNNNNNNNNNNDNNNDSNDNKKSNHNNKYDDDNKNQKENKLESILPQHQAECMVTINKLKMFIYTCSEISKSVSNNVVVKKASCKFD
eukprot:Pgem_evm1s5374